MLHAVVLAILARLIAAEFDPELHAKYLTMPKSSFIEYFNAQDYSWKMADNHIDEKNVACAHIDKESFNKLPVQTHDLEGVELPDNFDSREQWPKCDSIKQIFNQGQCGSCWTFGTATTASDRTCIHKDIHVNLSEQDLQCMKKDVCDGGDPHRAFVFWRDQGLVTQYCKPYDISKLKKHECVKKCVHTKKDYKKEKHFAEKIYSVSNNTDDIKAELFKNGPIEAVFIVYRDFMDYKSGIYEHKYGFIRGLHSVRLIGYGVENGTDYWLVANSWGKDWGEKGLFRIKPQQGDLEFEDSLLAGFPKN